MMPATTGLLCHVLELLLSKYAIEQRLRLIDLTAKIGSVYSCCYYYLFA